MATVMPNSFTERLAAEIARKGATKKAFSDAVGVHRATIYEWLAGDAEPSVSAVAAMADYFGCSMDYLWGRSDHREPLEGAAVSAVLRQVDPDALRGAVMRVVGDAVTKTVSDLQGEGEEGAGPTSAGGSGPGTKRAAGRLGARARDELDERRQGSPRTQGGRGS